MEIKWAVILSAGVKHVVPWMNGAIFGDHIFNLKCFCNPRVEHEIVVHGREN